MSSLKTNFNVSPYFDDYDEDKDFYKIIFRPAVAVQARELTQLQKIIQKQIERFGNNVFKDGTVVDGVAITYYPTTHYISLADTFTTNTALFPSDLDSSYLLTNGTDGNTAVRAVIKIAKDGLAVGYPDTNRFYVDYLTTGQSGGVNVPRFVEGDTIYIYDSNQSKLGTLDANNLFDTITTLSTNGVFTASGNAYCIGTSDGIVFQKGFFVKVDPHVITVRDYSTNVDNYVVGFDTVESIVNETADTSLNDNALGYENENAPGAHRLKLTPTLVAKSRTDSSNSINFFSIVEFSDEQPVEQNDNPAYNAVGRQLARRTYEESGDYVVNPFAVEARANTANTSLFTYEVSSGSGFVRGYRVEKVGTTHLTAPRATTTEYAQNQTFTSNYGNYVKCNQFLGAFDTETFTAVSLYDTAQLAVSQYEGVSSAPSGSEIGTAYIRAVAYNTGTKGSPQAEWYIYLFNIQMNSGSAFSDVRGIYSTSGTYGDSKADIILESGAAVLKSSSTSTAVFPVGLQAIKSLTNNTGSGDTLYTYTQIKTSTLLAAGGTVAVTIDTAGPGTSSEKLTSSPSTLTGPSIANYNIYLSANAYTANLTGSIALSSGNVAIVGTSTSFTSELAANSNIRIYANTSSTHIRRVVSVANATYLTLDAPITATNAACDFGEFFVGGTPLPLEDVIITSNTAFTANASLTLDSGNQTVYCQYPVYRNEATPIPKLINKSRYVKIDCSNNTATSVGPWNLGLTDMHKIRAIYVGTTYANTNTDRISWFNLDNGQRSNFYDHGQLVVKNQYADQIDASTKMLIELDYFTSNTSASVGFYSVESYPIDDVNTSNTSGVQTIELPRFGNTSVRDLIDFRPLKYSTAADSTTEGGATINPVTSNSTFNVPAGGQYQLSVSSTFLADYEYYLPRRDLITLDPEGNFIVNQGEPSVLPRLPFVENDQSAVISAFVPPFPSATKREYDVYKATTTQFIRTNIETNRRYTMRDIGVLEQRIKRLEYYTVLNVLEQQARDLTIPDSAGLNRFKNGIFADPFNSHLIGNVADFEYKIAIDPLETVARPHFTRHGLDLTFNSSNSANVQKTGPVLTLPYTNESYINQRFATKFRNTTESVWQWNGLTELYPSFDFFRDEQVNPNVQVDLDLAAPWEQFAQTPFGANFGDWRTTSSWEESQFTVNHTGADWGFGRNVGVETVTSFQTQQQIIDQLVVNASQQTIDLGSYVQDIALQPYLRSRIVAFVSYSMKPNTTLHTFFDGINVDEYCAPGELSGETTFASGREDRIVDQTAVYGTGLTSDSSGFVCGLFRIPAETFRTGDREFLLSNVDDLTTGADAQITTSTATFTGDSLSVTRGSTTLNVRQPEVSFTSQLQSRTLTNGIETQRAWDPIAQSFSVESLPTGISGTFISQIGVYFQSKDSNLGCHLYVVEMVNNTPNIDRIIGKAYLAPGSINTSTTGATETVFTLDYPIYLMSSQDYAFIVQPDGNSPEYNIWVGETGGFDVTSNEQVFSNPYNGLLFISANRKTWTVIQKEDLKFTIYRAKFDPLSGYAVFNNDDDEYITVDGFNRANTALGIEIGDLVYTINSSHTSGNVASIVSNTLSTAVYGRIQYIDQANGTIWLDSSTANGTTSFSNTTNPTIGVYRSADESNTAYLNANTLIAYANIATVDNLTYHATVPKFGAMRPAQASLGFNYKGTSITNDRDTSYVAMANDNDYEYIDVERHLMSKSNEIADLSSNKSSTFKVDFTSTSEYISPVINLSQKGSLFIENLINNDSTNEHTRYGSALARYISKTIELADGQEAEDLAVFLTAYRPTDTDIEIYARFWNNEDPDPFIDKVWTKLAYKDNGDTVYSSANRNDYIEYEFYVPTTNAVATGAFANTNVDTNSTLSGTVSIANNSYDLTGTGTSFDTELSVGDFINVVAGTYTAIRTVTNIANSTFATVDKGLQATDSAALSYVYTTPGNDGIVEYNNAAGSRFIGYKQMALKIVLLSSNPVRVPLLNDVRAICLQV